MANVQEMDRGADGFRHEALLYRGLGDLLDRASAFVLDGVSRGEAVLVVIAAGTIEAMRPRLGEDARRVRFADMADVGSNPARIIPAWRDFVDEHGGRAIRGVGEPIYPSRTPAELAEAQWHEALLNVAFADVADFRLLCPYDVTALPPAVVEHASRTHPTYVDTGVARPSEVYPGLEGSSGPFVDPLSAPPPDAVSKSFEREDLRAVRSAVHRVAVEAGLPERVRSDLVLAVSEVAANSVVHAGGSGSLLAWREPGAVVCEVRDAGFIDDPLAGRRRPTLDRNGGRGLWLANHLCDLVQIRSSERGTTVRLRMEVR